MKSNTETQTHAALAILQGDWDCDGTTSVHLPAHVARALLVQRGWTPQVDGDSGRILSWTHVESGHKCWETGEALTIELVAQTR